MGKVLSDQKCRHQWCSSPVCPIKTGSENFFLIFIVRVKSVIKKLEFFIPGLFLGLELCLEIKRTNYLTPKAIRVAVKN